MEERFQVAIVDDDPIWQKKIQKIIHENLQLSVDVFCDAESFLKTGKQYALLLLDIELPGMDGLTVLRQIDDLCDAIVFMSVERSYMQRAFGKNVYAFLDKTEKDEDIIETIHTIIHQLKSSQTLSLSSKDHGVLYVKINDIYRISYVGKEMIVTLKNDGIVLKRTAMKEIYELLPDHFVYSSKSAIVNLKHVVRIDGEVLFFDNGSQEIMSRRHRKMVLSKLAEVVSSW